METGDHCGKLNAASPGALSVDTEKRSPPTLDTLKEQSETQVSSAGAGVTVNGINGLDRNHSQASPPPIPPKRVLGKMSSLPSANGSGSPTVSRMIRDALPASSLAKTKKVQNVRIYMATHYNLLCTLGYAFVCQHTHIYNYVIVCV